MYFPPIFIAQRSADLTGVERLRNPGQRPAHGYKLLDYK